jgi:hypothetical protein
LLAKAAHFHRYESGKLAAQVFDVHSGAPINMWRIFIGKKGYFADISHYLLHSVGIRLKV